MNDHGPWQPVQRGCQRTGGALCRVVSRGPGTLRACREPSNLDELHHAERSLLEDLDLGTFRLRPNAVIITGTHEGAEVTATVRYCVEQPAVVWAPAPGEPVTGWSTWHDTIAQESTGSAGTCGTCAASTKRLAAPERHSQQQPETLLGAQH